MTPTTHPCPACSSPMKVEISRVWPMETLVQVICSSENCPVSGLGDTMAAALADAKSRVMEMEKPNDTQRLEA